MKGYTSDTRNYDIIIKNKIHQFLYNQTIFLEDDSEGFDILNDNPVQEDMKRFRKDMEEIMGQKKNKKTKKTTNPT